jgi:hypothetical protein
MPLIMKDIKKITEHLAGLKPAQPNLDSDLPVTVKEAVELLAPKLRHMKAQGFTLPELAAALAAHGLTVKPNTLSRYLAENQDGPLKKAPKKRRASKAGASTEPDGTKSELGSSAAAPPLDEPDKPDEADPES